MSIHAEKFHAVCAVRLGKVAFPLLADRTPFQGFLPQYARPRALPWAGLERPFRARKHRAVSPGRSRLKEGGIRVDSVFLEFALDALLAMAEGGQVRRGGGGAQVVADF